MARVHPNHDDIVDHLAAILRLYGLDAEQDPELQGTPDRIARFWAERFSGVEQGSAPELRVLPTSGDQEDMIIIRGIPFSSTCAHHFTPFFGHADIAYIPGEHLVGVGTPARVLDHFARRPQIQERLGEQVATFITKAIDPRGVMVHLTARQLCMELGGFRSKGHVETTATRGWFSDQEWRAEFFGRLGREPRA
ncbi:MAG: GTP cyclohydrolase I [Euryarchaeota archaeon]|nr:GTP cyclohydrolase I [Euryarchaeota archaeon]